MPLTKQVENRSALKERPRQPKTLNAEALTQRFQPATILHQARFAPLPPRPDELLLLQRTVGNRAVSRLLTESGPGRSRRAGDRAPRPTNDVARQMARTVTLPESPPLQRKGGDSSSAFQLFAEDITSFTPLSGGDEIYLEGYPPGSPIRVLNVTEYEQAGDDDEIKVELLVHDKLQRGTINGKKYIRPLAGSKPEPTIETLESDGETQDQYELGIAVARQNPLYLEFQKKRLKLTIKKKLNKVWGWIPKLFGKAGPKKLSNSDIKEQAAREAVKARSPSIDDNKLEEEAKKLSTVGGFEICGHTWIKLRKRVGTTLEKWSFGFYPAERASHPQEAVRGKVVSPDTEHESNSGEERLDLDYPISQKKYGKALTKAKKRAESPPKYKLTGYNCTKFAVDIAKAAGVSVPKSAWTVPFVGKMYSPNALYEAFQRLKNSLPKPKLPLSIKEKEKEPDSPEELAEEIEEEMEKEEEEPFEQEESEDEVWPKESEDAGWSEEGEDEAWPELEEEKKSTSWEGETREGSFLTAYSTDESESVVITDRSRILRFFDNPLKPGWSYVLTRDGPRIAETKAVKSFLGQ